MSEEESENKRLVRLLSRTYTAACAPREALIAALADDAAGDGSARAIVDALDEYLAEGPDRVPPRFAPNNTGIEVAQRLRAERDALLLRAERAEKALAEKEREVEWAEACGELHPLHKIPCRLARGHEGPHRE